MSYFQTVKSFILEMYAPNYFLTKYTVPGDA